MSAQRAKLCVNTRRKDGEFHQPPGLTEMCAKSRIIKGDSERIASDGLRDGKRLWMIELTDSEAQRFCDTELDFARFLIVPVRNSTFFHRIFHQELHQESL